MKNYLNILDTSEEDKEDKEHKLSFNNNTISLDTLSTSEKNIKKNAITPGKAKPLKNYLTLARNIMNKEINTEINSSGNNSDKNTNKLINISSKINNEINEPENMRYRDIKERDDNSDIGKKHIRKDVYGKEIKKGGNHRVTFADNVQMIKTRMKMEESQNNNNNDSIGEPKIKRVRTLRRSLIDLKNMQKRFDMERPERKKMNLVDIIEIENFKEFNKNDYLYPQSNDREDNLGNQEAICCSGICLVF